MSQLVTGEAVAVDLRIARLASRLPAAIIDGLIQLGLLLGAVFVYSSSGVEFDPAVAITLLLLTVFGVFLGYPVAFETLWRGRTPGKAAMGLRVVRDDGGPIRFRQALLRGLFGVFVDRFPTPLMFLGVIACLASERGKRLGDVAAGTVVLQERIPARTPTTIGMPPQLAAWASTLDLSGLPGNLALAVREFLGRAPGLTPAARDQLGRQLCTAVSAVVSPPPPPGTPGGAYLAAVLAERRRREEVRMRVGAVATAGPPAAAWASPPPAGEPSPWGSAAPAGAPSPWPASAPSTGAAPYLGSPPADPGPPAPVPASPPAPGPFAPPV